MFCYSCFRHDALLLLECCTVILTIYITLATLNGVLVRDNFLRMFTGFMCTLLILWMLRSFFLFFHFVCFSVFFSLIPLLHRNLHSLLVRGNKSDRLETFTQCAEWSQFAFKHLLNLICSRKVIKPSQFKPRQGMTLYTAARQSAADPRRRGRCAVAGCLAAVC